MQNLILFSMIDLEPIGMHTINDGVYLPAVFRLVLVVIIFASLGLTWVVARKNLKSRSTIQQAFMTAFIVAGLVYSLHADVTWYTWIYDGLKNQYAQTTEGRLENMHGDLYRCMRDARPVLAGHDYRLFAGSEYYDLITQYYLLPIRKVQSSPYVVLSLRPGATYSQKTGTLKCGDIIEDNMEVCVGYKYFCVLKKQ